MKTIYVFLLLFLLSCSSGRVSTPSNSNSSSSSTSSTNSIDSIKWFPLLGDIEPQPIKTTPKFHIQYQSNGFDRVRPNRIKKAIKYLRDKGASHLIERFREVANSVESISDWIDLAYETNVKQYQDCGGKFLQFIVSNNPSNIKVEVLDTPRFINGSWAGGFALSNAIDIKCVIVAVNGFSTNPTTSDLREFKDYVRWEVGNLLAFRYGVKPKKVEEEWGDFIPCSRKQP